MRKILRPAVFVFCILTSAQILAADETEDGQGNVTYTVELGLLDQTGSRTLSGSFKINFEKRYGKNLFALDAEEHAVVKWAPEVTFSVTKVELASEEKTTKEIALTVLSLTLEGKDFEPFIKLKAGRQDIETISESGEESSDENTVFIWNPGVTFEINDDVEFTWDYQLSQKKVFSDKTQHKSTFKLVFKFG